MNKHFILSASLQNKIGMLLLIAVLFFTFFYSLGYTLNSCQADYMYYMQLVGEGNYSKNVLIAGFLWLYKPFLLLFGHTYWVWNRFHWVLNLAIVFIPYIVLLNTQQQRKYLFVAALAVLFSCTIKTGCDPTCFVLLSEVIAIVCFIKYMYDKRVSWILAMSLLVAFTVFLRFPSLFIYPCFLFAIFAVCEKKLHTLLFVVLPVVFFAILTSITNGNLLQYCTDLQNSVGRVTSDSDTHGIGYLFYMYLGDSFQLLKFSIIVSAFFWVVKLWKDSKKWHSYIALILFLICANLIRVNPIPRWGCAITVAVAIIFCLEKRFSRQAVVVSLLAVCVPMATTIGSNNGLFHDWMALCLLPFIAVHSFEKDNKDSFGTKNVEILRGGGEIPDYVLGCMSVVGIQRCS